MLTITIQCEIIGKIGIFLIPQKVQKAIGLYQQLFGDIDFFKPELI